MKKTSTLLLFLFFCFYYYSACTHTLRLTDTFGDGWNGGTVSVSVNGVNVVTNATIASGYGPTDFTFNANSGDVIRIYETAAGSYPTEMRAEVFDGGMTSIIAQHDPIAGTLATGGTTGTGNCPPPMSITAATVVQASSAGVGRCGQNQQIVCLQITTTGVTTPKTVTQIQTNFSGSAGVAALSGADIYYTGTSSTFSTTTLFGSNASPTVATYSINGSQVLSTGINYFWLVYDLNNTGTIGNDVDGAMTQFTASAVNYNSGSTPAISTTNPAGTRTLTMCTAPGGVTGGLETWVKADGGITNQASAGTPIVANGSPAINNTSTSYNYNPYIDFTAPAGVYTANGADANRQFLKISGYNGVTGMDYRSLFWACNMTDLTRTYTHLATTDDITHSAPSSCLHGHASGAVAAIDDPGYDVNDFGSSAALGTWKRNGTSVALSPLTSQVHTTNKQILSAWSSAGGGTTLNRFFGGQRDHSSNGFMGSPRDWKGPAAELIGYTVKVTATERQKIHTYLAIKYGVTLSEDYLSTSGGTIYSVASYGLNVIGIGRDDAEGLLQKQSHQDDDTVRIYISSLAGMNASNAGTFTNDISYVVMGANSGKLCTTGAAMGEIPSGLTSCALTSRLTREWKVTRTNMAQNYHMDVKLNACGAPGTVNVAHLRFLVDDDGNFGNGGTQCYYNGDGTGIVISYSNPTITISNISTTHVPNNATKFITIASINTSTPLPVELLTYDATLNKQKKVDLTWTTSAERDNDYFTIEKSTDGENWTYLNTVDGAGNSNTEHDYIAVDPSPSFGTNYYRLSQTDFNGVRMDKGIREIKMEQEGVYTLAPNPATSILGVFGKNVSEMEITLFNSLGEIITIQKNIISEDHIEIVIEHLASGSYFVRLENEVYQDVQKLIVQQNK